MRAGETERGGDSRFDRTRLNNFLIIECLRTRNRSARRREFVYGPPSADCADFAHRIGEIGKSAKLLRHFSPSVQKLHRHTFCSAK